MTDNAIDTDKARQLRALYRGLRPAAHIRNGKQILDQAQQDAQWRAVKAEFARLYPGENEDLLAHIISTAWVEGRTLAGETYDYQRQAWRGRDGAVVDG